METTERVLTRDEQRVENLKIRRGEIWTVDLGYDNMEDSEQRGYRPALVIQNDKGNRYSPTVIVACVTSKGNVGLPTHMGCDLFEPSTVMFEQIKTISKKRFNKRIATLNEEEMEKAGEKIMISMGLMEVQSCISME